MGNGFSSAMIQNDETEQKPEVYCRDDEQFDCGDAVSMVSQKGEPALRWRLSSSNHVIRDCRLRHVDSKLDQFTMDPWCTP